MVCVERYRGCRKKGLVLLINFMAEDFEEPAMMIG